MKFHKEDADAILRIPLSKRFVADSIFWLFNRDGDYSVKSGYKVACKVRREASMQGESSMAAQEIVSWCGERYGRCTFQIKLKSSCGGLVMVFYLPMPTCFENM